MSNEKDKFIKDFERQLEWFCDKIMEPVPYHPDDKENVFNRMIAVGWIRQSEVDTYKDLTKDD